MTHRRGPAFTLFFLALILMSSAESARTAEVTIGESNIVVPEPAGFASYTDDEARQHPIAFMLDADDCPIGWCVIFMGRPRGGQGAAPHWEGVPAMFVVQATDMSPVSPELFAEIRRRLKADIDFVRDLYAQRPEQEKIDVGRLSLDHAELEFIDAPIELSEHFYEGDIYLGIPASVTNNYRRPDGSIVSYEFQMTVGFIHAANGVLMLMIVQPGDDAEWSESALVEYAEALANANPVD